MRCYQAFGLNIASDLPLPELLPGGSPTDVVIRTGRLGTVPSGIASIQCLRADPGEALLAWQDVGLAIVRNGAEIIIDPLPGADVEAVRIFLLGAVFGVLLHQRGFTVLHASAVNVAGRVVAFVGEKGAGKSTLAAALCARGHLLLSDDLLVVEENSTGPLALYGFPQLKIWPETAEAVGINPRGLDCIRPGVEKRIHRPAHVDVDAQARFPLHEIFVLGVGEPAEYLLLPNQVAYLSLMRHLYVSRFGKLFHQPGLQPVPLAQCAALVSRVPITVFRRPADLSNLSTQAALLEQRVLQAA